jgi:hypothetical protein
VADKIAKKLPKRCSRGKGAWIAIARGRDNAARVLPSRNARQGINGIDLNLVGSAAYRRRRGW